MLLLVVVTKCAPAEFDSRLVRHPFRTSHLTPAVASSFQFLHIGTPTALVK